MPAERCAGERARGELEESKVAAVAREPVERRLAPGDAQGIRDWLPVSEGCGEDAGPWTLVATEPVGYA
jgi:hypothetical protein